jgi:hypothetical protein
MQICRWKQQNESKNPTEVSGNSECREVLQHLKVTFIASNYISRIKAVKKYRTHLEDALKHFS